MLGAGPFATARGRGQHIVSATAEKTIHHATAPRQETRQEARHAFVSRSEERGSFFRPMRPFIQARLEVSKPDDPHEREAEATAERVMQMPGPMTTPATGVEAKRISPAHGQLQREADAESPADEGQVDLMREPGAPSVQHDVPCAREWTASHGDAGARPHGNGRDGIARSAWPGDGRVLRHACTGRPPRMVQRSARGPPETPAGFESQLQQSKGSGNELPHETRAFMESRFQSDFGGVRIHTDAGAQTMARSIQAQAFTHGGDIYFNSGRYDPDSLGGRTLLAHELTHTIQQGASPVVARSKASAPGGGSHAPSKDHRSTTPIQCRRAMDARADASFKPVADAAMGERGKVHAGVRGPDGKRSGWRDLHGYFKEAMGADKLVSAPPASARVPGTILEETITQAPTEETSAGKEQESDAVGGATLPGWSGALVFWALKRGGVPMPPWSPDATRLPSEAAYPPDHAPRQGDVAVHGEEARLAIVGKTSGQGPDADITTVEGDAAGVGQRGGEIAVHTRKRSAWAAFFNPKALAQDGKGAGAHEEVEPMTLGELRHEAFHVNTRTQAAEMPGVQKSALPTQAATHVPAAVVPAPDPVKRLDREPGQEGADKDKREDESRAEVARHIDRQLDPSRVLRAVDVAGRGMDEAAPTMERVAAPVATRSPGTVSRVASHDGTPGAWESGRGPPIAVARPGAVVQRSWFGDAWKSVSGAISDMASVIEKGLDHAKKFLLGKARDFVRALPGYTMLSFVLAKDPVTGEAMERNGHNLLEAALDMIPLGAVFRVVIDSAGARPVIEGYLDARIADMSAMAAGVMEDVHDFWAGLGLESMKDPEALFRKLEGLLSRALSAIKGFVTSAAADFLATLKRMALSAVSDFVRSHIPRLYPLLCVALGYEPVTNTPVPRNGTNILNAVLSASEEGEEQKAKLEETGTFRRIAAYIDRGIAVFSTAYQMFRAGFSKAWDMVSIESLASPVATFEKVYAIFREPVTLVTGYIKEVAIEILRVVKDALLRRLRDHAKSVTGYTLLTVILGEDPFTHEKVPATVENLIRGFMTLMDGGEEQFKQMKESGAIDKATGRIQTAVDQLNMTPDAIIALFIGLWNSFSLRDILHPIDAFKRILATFGKPLARLVAFVIEIIKIVVDVVLQVMKFPIELVGRIMANAATAFHLIKADPVAFLKNLLRSIKQGFIQFFDNILSHLLHGVTEWLMSELKDAGVPTLSDFSLRGVIGWVLAVLGITMEKIWEKLAEHPRIGPQRVQRIRGMIDKLEGIWTFIKDVQERGVAAIWDKIQEQLSNLWETVLDSVKNWIMEKIINAMVTKLLSMLDPSGIMAVVNSAIAIYSAIQSFVRYLAEMLRIVNSFVEGVVEIAQGNISRAANALENALHGAMPVVIGFLANQVNLGGVGKKVGEILVKVQALVDKALSWLVNKAVDTAFAIFDKLFGTGGKADDPNAPWWKNEMFGFTAEDNSRHNLFLKGSNDNPQLFMRSKEVKVEEFLNEIKEEYKDDTKKTEGIEAAEKTRKEILAKASSGANKSAKASSGANKSAVVAAINKMTQELAKLFKKGKKPERKVDWGPENPFGTRMTATGWWKKPKGSGQNPARNNSHYDLLAKRRNGGTSYYVKGHLLSQKLHGKGALDNMTPLSISGNHNHEDLVESKLKMRFNSNMVFDYIVHPVGDHKSEFGSVITKLPKGRDENTAYNNEITKVLEKEKEVCRGLHCTVEHWKLKGGEWKKGEGTKEDLTVLNPVEIPEVNPETGMVGKVGEYITNPDNKMSTTRYGRLRRRAKGGARVAGKGGGGGGAFFGPGEAAGPRPGALVQRKEVSPGGGGAGKVGAFVHGKGGVGEPLGGAVRQFFEAQTGASLGTVRVHRDGMAGESAAALGAQAYTVGESIVFGHGRYAPETSAGRELLSHELVHVLQQRRGGGEGVVVQMKADASATAAVPGAKAGAGEGAKGSEKEEKAGPTGAGTVGKAGGTSEEQAAEREGAKMSQPLALPDFSTRGPETRASARGGGVMFEGRTEATFDGGVGRTMGLRAVPTKDCDGCAKGECLQVTGALRIDYGVTCRVTLPEVPPGLTACQQREVSSAIQGKIKPHEADHVKAFGTYNGSVTLPIQYTGCKAGLQAHVQAMHNADASRRQSAAKAMSAALDPFNVEVDLDCEDEPPKK